MENILKLLNIIRNDIVLLSKQLKLPEIFKVKVVEMPEKQIKVDVNVPEIKASDIKIPEIDASKIKIPAPEVKVNIPEIKVPSVNVPKPEVKVDVNLSKIEKILSDFNKKELKVEKPDLKGLVKEIAKENKKFVDELKNAISSIKVEIPEIINAKLISVDEQEAWDYKDIKTPIAVGVGGGGGASISDDRFVSYYPSDEDISDSVEYFGFLNHSGKWEIKKHDKLAGTWRYARGETDYSSAWNNRASLVYTYFNVGL